MCGATLSFFNTNIVLNLNKTSPDALGKPTQHNLKVPLFNTNIVLNLNKTSTDALGKPSQHKLLVPLWNCKQTLSTSQTAWVATPTTLLQAFGRFVFEQYAGSCSVRILEVLVIATRPWVHISVLYANIVSLFHCVSLCFINESTRVWSEKNTSFIWLKASFRKRFERGHQSLRRGVK